MSVLILETSGYSKKALRLYSAFGDVFLGRENAKLSSVEILVVRLNYKIDQRLCHDLPKLKIVATPTTGLTHIDMTYLKSRNVRVISLRDTPVEIKSISSTTEISLWHIINVVRKASFAANSVTNKNEWQRDDYRTRQLSNMALGIVGLGRIGLQVANVCCALGMSVSYFDPNVQLNADHPLYDRVVKRDNLSELLESSEIVSIHLPLDAHTRCLFDNDLISQMKHGAYLVNTARGELVDEMAIELAIQDGRLSGYACDVVAGEQDVPIEENKLVQLSKLTDRIQLTPHIGGCTQDAMHLTEEIIAEKVLELVDLS